MSDLSQYLGGGFNADEIADDNNYDNSPLPKGDYYVEVESAKTQETNNTNTQQPPKPPPTVFTLLHCLYFLALTGLEGLIF